MTHPIPSIYAGITVRVRSDISFYMIPQFATMVFTVQDYYDRVIGMSWQDSKGSSLSQSNQPVVIYSIRQRLNKLPLDDEVLIGTLNGDTVLLHYNEIEIGSGV